MSITQITVPSKTVIGETSKWNAVGNPIVYVLERRDYTFNQINSNGGFIQLQFNGVDITSSFNIGDQLYIRTTVISLYDLVATVTAISFSTHTLVTLSASYTSGATTGFTNNLTTRPLYRLNVEVYNISGTLLNESVFTYTTDTRGVITVDVSKIIRANLSPDNNHPASTESYNDAGAYLNFYIKYTEIWTGSAESQTNDSANNYWAIIGSRQIPSTYGGNMAEYVTFNDGSPLALFLTKLTSPVMWRDWPYLVSLIGGSNVVKDAYVSANGDEPTHVDIEGRLYSFDLNEIVSDQTVESVALIAYNDDTTDVAMTGTLNIQLRDACQNPIMLLGRNSLGGCLQWMFDVNQEYTFDYGGGRKAKRLVLTAVNLTIDQWEALQDFITLGEVYKDNIVTFTSSTIKTSSRIGQQVYVLNQDGTKTGVIVIPTRNTTMTKAIKHIFEIEIEYPEQFAV